MYPIPTIPPGPTSLRRDKMHTLLLHFIQTYMGIWLRRHILMTAVHIAALWIVEGRSRKKSRVIEQVCKVLAHHEALPINGRVPDT